jgi:uncharacterized protein
MSATAPGSTAGPRPLPIRLRPMTGESELSYIRRLARANHLRPGYLRRYLKDPGKNGGIRLGWLAILAGRPIASLEYAFAGLGARQGRQPPGRHPAGLGSRKPGRAALFTIIRRDAYIGGLPIRALADRHGVGRRAVLQALKSPIPPPRKQLPARKSRLDPFKDAIEIMLQHDAPFGQRQTVKSIADRLAAEHGMTGISYSTVRDYVVDRRGIRPRRPGPAAGTVPWTLLPESARRNTVMSWSPAHLAVEHENLPRLRDLLDAGHDVEDDDGDGWTLLRHAIDAQYDGHQQAGGPLHADVTAFLLARGADPMRRGPGGMPAVTEAEIRGHWLAAEIMRAWIERGHPSGTQ